MPYSVNGAGGGVGGSLIWYCQIGVPSVWNFITRFMTRTTVPLLANLQRGGSSSGKMPSTLFCGDVKGKNTT